jgi:tRNA threonylcarbamoyladenosine biosynthesis protein TsaB
MKVLGLETATDLVGAALLRDGAVAERSHLGGRAHAELLAPAVEEVCALSGTTLAEVDAVAVDLGPGLFTGLRVGVATAKALGQSLGVGVLGVSSLDVLAAGAYERAPGERTARVVVAVDARRGEVFAAAYAAGAAGGGPDGPDPADVRTDRAEALTPDELVTWCDSLASGGPVLVVGDGAVRYLEQLASRPGLDLGLAVSVSAPSPAVLVRLAARRLAAGASPTAAADVVPDYRRPPDARINWEERAPQRTAVPPVDGAR